MFIIFFIIIFLFWVFNYLYTSTMHYILTLNVTNRIWLYNNTQTWINIDKLIEWSWLVNCKRTWIYFWEDWNSFYSLSWKCFNSETSKEVFVPYCYTWVYENFYKDKKIYVKRLCWNCDYEVINDWIIEIVSREVIWWFCFNTWENKIDTILWY